ncbi:D-alanyl-D-alanine carboxypeptidase/D-alanyl-D-alanine-endopeptidase [Ectobacillus sp. JY-23]|uniref:D-alanyl-D-alanine carboxypeptidase/D-alanyl-D-alanine endopeptidase n=1 Tax=Ectobacillus sp. JY-23 TaxID=2933872 RepID=UPI001FF4E060|nr:D-alanyl-D-alanine carboxypeptidase/D-alanyl-D-alanine-endopeptidase [Ectobacillus sp. JY-23]UOY92466.1 D-alanyl-D-alanine carboxypeptidase/D-alanyl-D-alanine-endopeptidase [Ectobacillus sp. JY-23]
MKRTMKWLISFLLMLQLIQLPVYAESGTSVVTSISQIDQLVANLPKSASTIGMRAGISVYNTKTGESVYQHDADKTFVPASNLKLYVTAAALDRLGEEYRFRTEVYTTGHVNPQGTLLGDVVIKGYGDPSLSKADLTALAVKLKDAGVKAVNGNILVDDSYYDDMRLGEGWMWDDEIYTYSAQISALAVNENVVDLSISAAGVEVEPRNDVVKIDNRASVVEGTKTDLTIDRQRGSDTIVITGTIGKDAAPYTDQITVEDPALFAADAWKYALRENGIALKKAKVEKTAGVQGTPLVVHESQPLSALIVRLNKESDNFYAEMLVKQLGASQKGEGSFDAGADVIATFLEKAGIPTNYKQVDGSGLSRLNLISPKQMAQLLTYVDKQPYQEAFERSLPIAGVDGTLKSRMKGTSAEKNVRAKTGSMSGVNGLSGYVTGANGDKLAFSVFLNGVRTSRTATNFQDAVGVLLTQYPAIMDEGAPSVPDTFLLTSLLDPILDQEALKGVTAGVVVGSLDRNNGILYSRNADALLTPASNMKLLTTAAALKALGADYTFKTELYTTALPDKHGRVNGDVIIKGYGDPTLQTEDPSGQASGTQVARLVQALKDQHITAIEGDIIVDDSQYDAQRLGTGWAWDDETYGYNPQISALSVNRSAVRVEYEAGTRAGQPVVYRMVPNTRHIQIINEAKTVAAGADNTFTVEKERGTNIIRLQGELPIGEAPDYERIAVEEPSLYAGTVIKEEMEKEGIQVDKRAEVKAGTVNAQAQKMAEVSSLPLRDIIMFMNKNSDNFYAEMLLKRLGADKKGIGSASAGAQVVRESLQLYGINPIFRMVDGSGLSRYNTLSAVHMATLLRSVATESFFDAYYGALPIAGVDGTLRNRMKETLAQNNVYAKTGTLQGVSGLSGYVKTKDGERLYFSILLNGYTSTSRNLTSAQDQIATALAELSFQ